MTEIYLHLSSLVIYLQTKGFFFASPLFTAATMYLELVSKVIRTRIKKAKEGISLIKQILHF